MSCTFPLKAIIIDPACCLQLVIHNKSNSEQHGFWPGASCQRGVVCPPREQMGGKDLSWACHGCLSACFCIQSLVLPWLV